MKTIFFDFGNVIGFFDHGRALANLVRHTDLSREELEQFLYGSPLADDYECGRVSTEEFVLAAVRDGRLTCADDDFLAAYTDIFWPNPEVCDLVPRLAGRYRLVLASNTNAAHFGRFRDTFADVLRPFAHLGTSHTAGHRKPAAGFFAALQEYAGAEPRECVFVDDLPENVAAAERHGWRGVVYRPGGSLPEQLRAAGIKIGPADPKGV